MAAPTGLRSTLSLPNSEDTKAEGDEAAIDQATTVSDIRPMVDPTPTDNMVTVRVLPKGDGKVSRGEYDKASNTFPFYKRGETFKLARVIAQAQEDNGFLEIMD